MPHPERAMESILGGEDGIKMLKGFLKWRNFLHFYY
jgi:phosphoribosylformylglycinamidine synthase